MSGPQSPCPPDQPTGNDGCISYRESQPDDLRKERCAHVSCKIPSKNHSEFVMHVFALQEYKS